MQQIENKDIIKWLPIIQRQIEIINPQLILLMGPLAAKTILNSKKHVLVEKPLFVKNKEELVELQNIANRNKVILYTAYNHRFEPHFINMKNLLINKALGKIFRLRMFYGNGTSGLVKQSEWRDQGSGVLLDIGSHLLDTLIFWFGDKNIDIKLQLNL